jgi:hypothetical protein
LNTATNAVNEIVWAAAEAAYAITKLIEGSKMDIEGWHPIAHWVKVFEFKLKEIDVRRFSGLCVMFAKDERVSEATGYAEVWNARHPKGIELFAPHLVRDVASALMEVKDEPAMFLRATHNVEYIPWPHEQRIFFMSDSDAWPSAKLSKTQERYALNVYEAFNSRFLVNVYNDTLESGYCDAGMVFFAASIAKARYPKRRDARPRD